MPRIAGVDVPDNKPIHTAIRYIYGVGPFHAQSILKEANIDGQTRANKLTEDQWAQIAAIIDNISPFCYQSTAVADCRLMRSELPAIRK